MRRMLPPPALPVPAPPASWRAQVAAVLALEWALIVRHRRLAVAAVALVLVPTVYALIFLWAVWDPAGHTRALPVGLVNLDTGAHFRGRDLNLGAEALAAIERQGQFAYRRFADPAEARAQVRRGQLAFALEIPPEFSRLAVPGERPGAARLVLYTSEGNNYTSASLARRFAPEVAQRVNAMLGESRWALVLSSAQGSQRDLDSLRSALGELHHGAEALGVGLRRAREGADTLAQGTRETAEGAQQLRTGAGHLAAAAPPLAEGLKPMRPLLRQLEAARPADGEVKALADGLHQAHEGQQALHRALGQLAGGSERLVDGLQTYGNEAAELPLVGQGLASGLAPLQQGARQLADGLGAAQAGSQQLLTGLGRLDHGLAPLVEGHHRLGQVLNQASARLPEDSRLDGFVGGARELAQGSEGLAQGLRRLAGGHDTLRGGLASLSDGAVRLDAGIEALRRSLPPAPDAPSGSARGLAVSVEAQVDAVAAVPNNGVALMPNFVPLALWVGAVTAAFLSHWRRLAAPVAACRRSARVVGKLLLPAAVVLAQSAVMWAALVLGLGLQPAQPLALAVTLAVSSLAFLGLVFALVRLLGELGKAVAVLLLVVQVAAAGAVLPIELSDSPFQTLHPVLPLTWVVHAFKATLFGAYEGVWAPALGFVAACGAAGVLVGAWVGRWRVVPMSDWRPPLDIE